MPVPAGDQDPVLRLEGRGPLSPVEAVAFGPRGVTLYEAGWDKVVRVWRRDARTGQFTLDPSSTLRVPIGPGDAGVLNALAVSADGAWLAVGGQRRAPGRRRVPAGRIDFAERERRRSVWRRESSTSLTCGPILLSADRFADTWVRCRRWCLPPSQKAGNPCSFPPARNPNPGAERSIAEVARVGHRDAKGAASGRRLASARDFRPWLAAWSVAPDHDRIRAAAAWTNSSSLIWDVGLAPPRLLADPHEGRSTVLSYLPEKRMLLTGHFGIPARATRRIPRRLGRGRGGGSS